MSRPTLGATDDSQNMGAEERAAALAEFGVSSGAPNSVQPTMSRGMTTPIGDRPSLHTFPMTDERSLGRALTLPDLNRSSQPLAGLGHKAPVIEATRLQGQFGLPVGAPDLVGDRPETQPLRLSVYLQALQKNWKQLCYVFFFIGVDTMRSLVDAWALRDKPPELTQCLVVMQALLSLLLGLAISRVMEGMQGVRAAFSPKEVLRTVPVGACFMASQAFLTRAYAHGLPAANAQALGYLYMPLSAILSRFAFGRKYGWLEVHALLLITFASATFGANFGKIDKISDNVAVFWSEKQFLFSILSTCFAVAGAIAMERLLKPKYHPSAEVQRFWVQKVRLEISTCLTSIVWLFVVVYQAEWALQIYDGLDFPIALALIIRIAQAWMAGWLAKHLSTVAKGVIHSLTLVSVYFIGCALPPLNSPTLAGTLLTIVIGQAALMYQFGRRTARRKRKTPAPVPAPAPQPGQLASIPSESAGMATRFKDKYPDDESPSQRAQSSETRFANFGEVAALAEPLRNTNSTRLAGAGGDSYAMAERGLFDQELLNAVSDIDSEDESDVGDFVEDAPRTRKCRRWINCGEGLLDEAWLQQMRQLDDRAHEFASSFMGIAAQASAVLFFIVADAGKILIFAWAVHGTPIVPQSLVVAMSSSSVPIGMAVSASTGGVAGALACLNYRPVLMCLPVAALFSLGQSANTHAFSLNISATLSTVIGYSYMPLSALLSRWIFKRAYSFLEWLALSLITCCAIVFVLVRGSSGGGGMSVEAIASAALSVIFSCCGSLAAEKVLKGDCEFCGLEIPKNIPFYTQKVHIEIGGTVTAVAMLFVLGLSATPENPNDAFWLDRNVTDGVKARGVFVGWGYKTYIALAATIAQSWLGGLVSKRLSTVVRAVAQCMSLVIIYYVGDLMIDGPHCRRDCDTFGPACPSGMVADCLHFQWPVALCSLNLVLGVQVFAQAGIKQKEEAEAAQQEIQEQIQQSEMVPSFSAKKDGQED